MIASLNSFFTFAGCEHLKIKTIKEQRQIFCSEDKELTKEEYTRLLNAAESKGNKRLNLILQTMCETSIRVSELKFITIEAVKKGEAFVFARANVGLCLLSKRYRKNCFVMRQSRKSNPAAFLLHAQASR